MARASIAAGADGLLIEVHCDPDKALERRRAVAVPGPVRSADGGAAHHRAGDRPQHLRRAGASARAGRRMPRRAAGQLGRAPPSRRFATIAIVGVGLIGGSVGLAARARWPGVRVIGVDAPRRAGERGRARRRHRRRRRRRRPRRAADLVVLCAPVAMNVAAAGDARRRASRPARVVTDVGSTKRDDRRRGRGASGSTSFVGGHPLAGAATSGTASRARAAVPRPAVDPDADGARARRPRSSGCAPSCGRSAPRPTVLDAGRHDRLMAYVSHLPQVVASALLETVGATVGETGWRCPGPASPTRRGWPRARRRSGPASSPPTPTTSREAIAALEARVGRRARRARRRRRRRSDVRRPRRAGGGPSSSSARPIGRSPARSARAPARADGAGGPHLSRTGRAARRPRRRWPEPAGASPASTRARPRSTDSCTVKWDALALDRPPAVAGRSDSRARRAGPASRSGCSSHDTVPAGFAELERSADGSVEIVYFGLLPDFIGRGVGRAFLDAVVARAWDGGTTPRLAPHLHARPSPGAPELPVRRVSRRPRRGLHGAPRDARPCADAPAGRRPASYCTGRRAGT